MDLKIPKEFYIFHEKYKVRQLKKVDSADSWGEHDFQTNTIKIKKDLEDNHKERTYLHEVLHCILEQLAYDKLSKDEKFVDQMATALHQVLKSSK
jgi:hypothetical protein